MNYRGVEYTVVPASTPGVWQWQFRIGDKVKAGATRTNLKLMAIRRVEERIDRELKQRSAPDE